MRSQDMCQGPTDLFAAAHIGPYYSAYSQEIVPLCDFKSLPDDLSAVPQANGDIVLRYSNGQEATFDVIGVIIGSCLEAPTAFAK